MTRLLYQPVGRRVVAQIVEVPAGLAEEAVERAIVFELGQLGGLNDAGQG